MSPFVWAKVSKPKSVDSGIAEEKVYVKRDSVHELKVTGSYFYKHQKHSCFYFSLSIAPRAMGSLFAGKAKGWEGDLWFLDENKVHFGLSLIWAVLSFARECNKCSAASPDITPQQLMTLQCGTLKLVFILFYGNIHYFSQSFYQK